MDTKDQSVLFSHKSDNWQTPIELFSNLNEEFHFTIDGAADSENHLLPRWWGPGSEIAEDALATSWAGETVWLNPPYSMCSEFMKKAWEETVWNIKEHRYACQVVTLVPSRTDTKWWHNYVWNEKYNDFHVGIKVRFVRGRLKFIDPTGDPLRKGTSNSAPFPSVIVIFGA